MVGVHHQNKCFSNTRAVTGPISTMLRGFSEGDRTGNQIDLITYTEFKQDCPFFLDAWSEAFIQHGKKKQAVQGDFFLYYLKRNHIVPRI